MSSRNYFVCFSAISFTLSAYCADVELAFLNDIRTGPANSEIKEMVKVGQDTVFFVANSGNGFELWKTNGYSLSTVKVLDSNGTNVINPTYLCAVGSTVFFASNDGPNGYELWKSDGTQAGTVQVKDIRGPANDSTSHSNIQKLVAVNGKLFFTANDGQGDELWVSDGTTAGTVKLDINPAVNTGSTPTYPCAVGSWLYFAANNGTNGFELWRSNGTAVGTTLVMDINAGAGHSNIFNTTAYNGCLLFTANNGTGDKLWKSDPNGTTAIVTNAVTSPGGLIVAGSYLYFVANGGSEVWKSDGTSAGTTKIQAVPANLTGITVRKAVNGKLLFTAMNGTTYYLYSTDGSSVTQRGTWQSLPMYFANVGSHVYFAANNGSTGYELWRCDGNNNSALVADIMSGGSTSHSNINNIVGILDTAIFSATGSQPSSVGDELWSYGPKWYVDFESVETSVDELEGVVNLHVRAGWSPLEENPIYYTVTGTATSGVDHLLSSGSWDPNSYATLDVPIVPDLAVEGNETITITIVGAAHQAIGLNSQHTVTIVDNDRPAPAFTTATNTINEDGTPEIKIALSYPAELDLDVEYVVTGTADSHEDYILDNGIITIQAGMLEYSLPLTYYNDALDEDNETVIVTLTNSSIGPVGLNSVHTLTIIDNDDPPVVEFLYNGGSADESVSPATISAGLSVASEKVVSIDYTVSGGTATGGGTDYVLANGTLVFNPTEVWQDILATIVDDEVFEDNETIIITLSNPVNATLGANTVYTCYINDSVEAPTVAFVATESNGAESGTPATFSVSLSTVADCTVWVEYTVSGTATGGGTDHTLANGTLSFAAGETSKNLLATIVNDAFNEPNETITVTLGSTNAFLGDNVVHTYTINDDDATPTVAFSAASSNGAENATPATITVTLSAAPSQTVTVDYALTGTATGSGTDYTLAGGTLTFNAGETSKDLSAAIVNDTLDEANETIIVTLSNPINATLGTNAVHTYTINDNDDAPTVAFSATSSNGAENATPATMTVSLSAASGQSVSVDYALTGTATGGGIDYTLANGTLTFNAGETSKDLSAVIVNDTLDEANETIIVTLSNPANATLGTNAVHTYTINDNDDAPTVAFSATSSNGAENATPATMAVTLSAASGQAVTVDYALTGTATGGGTDYTLANGTLTINAGDTSKDLSAAIINDSRHETDETIIVTLSNPINAVLGTNTVHTFTILDNDENAVPVALPNAYTVAPDTALNISAPGVLGNDSDADADDLTATKVADPENGTVEINADGSFVYTPDNGFQGTDHFTYRANDPFSSSAAVQVSILVQAPDTTPPVITQLVPADASLITHPLPVISANYSDAATGINLASVIVTLDGTVVPAHAAIPGFSYTPVQNLAEGAHTVTLSVADNAGNVQNSSWSFDIDSKRPVATMTIAPRSPTNDSTPEVNIRLADTAGGTGIDTASVLFKIDNTTLTNALVPDAGGFTYQSAALADGTHIALFQASDLAGNQVSVTASVTVDTTPPNPPTVTYVEDSPTQVLIAGTLPAGDAVLRVTPTITPTLPVSISISGSAFQAVVENGNVSTFNISFNCTDSANNTSANSTPTSFTEDDDSDGEAPANMPPPLPTVSNLVVAQASLSGDEEEVIDNVHTYFTNKDSINVTVNASVGGGASIDKVQILLNGIAYDATGVGGSYAATIPLLSDGQFELSARATAKKADLSGVGQLAKTKILIADRVAPEFKFSVPSTFTTAPLGFLFLNGLSEAQCAAIRIDPDLPRNVYSKDITFTGSVVERQAGPGSSITIEVREVGAENDLQIPYYDYAKNKQDAIPGILVNPAISKLVDTTATLAQSAGNPSFFEFLTADFMAALPDSVRVEGGQPVSKIYLVTFVSKDRAGNESLHHSWAKKDTNAPTGTYLPQNLNSEGPIYGLHDFTIDLARVFDSTVTPMPRAEINGLWLFSTPRNLPVSSHVRMEDIAGNYRDCNYSLTLNYTDDSANKYEEYQSHFREIQQWITPSVIGGPDAPPVPWEFWQSGAKKSIAGINEQILETTPAWIGCYNNATGTIEWQPNGTSYLPERTWLADLTVSGKHYAALSPQWLMSLPKPVVVQGSFPYAFQEDFMFGCVAAFRAAPNPMPAAPRGQTTTFSVNILGLDISSQVCSGLNPTSGNGSVIYGRNGYPGTQTVIVDYSGGFDAGVDTTDTTHSDFGDGYTLHTTTSDTFISYARGTGSPSKYRAFSVFEVTPSILIAGRNQNLRVRGWFEGKNIGQGLLASLPVVSGAGTINVSTQELHDAAHTPVDGGILTYEDVANASAVRTVNLSVIPASDASGTFRMTVGGAQLDEVVQVTHFGIVVDANDDGAVNAADRMAPGTNGFVLTSGFRSANEPSTSRRVRAMVDAENTFNWMSYPANSPILKRGTLKIINSNSHVRLFESVASETALTNDDLTFDLIANNLSAYYDAEGALLDNYYISGTKLFLENEDEEEPDTEINFGADALKWRRKSDGELFDALPDELFVEFLADDSTTLSMSYKSAANTALDLSCDTKVVRISNGLGADDGIAPHASVVGGYASTNLTGGNLYFGQAVRTYRTPAFGPSVSISYNSRDGFDSGLGRGWRTNYDMQLLDGSVDSNLDGKVQLFERAENDRLYLIDETGRRIRFNYNPDDSVFNADPKSGLVAATIDVDPANFDLEGTKGYAYKLVRHDNLCYFFSAKGLLMRVENLRGKGVTVARNAQSQAIYVVDDYGRSEGLTRLAFNANAEGPLTGISGRNGASWSFAYEGDAAGHQVIDSFTVNGATYGLTYDSLLSKVTQIDLPESVSRIITYIPADFVHATGASITEPFGGATAYVIDPVLDAWTEITDTTGVETVRTVNGNRRVTNSATGSQQVAMQYDARGNLTSQTTSGTPNMVLTYVYSDFGMPGANLLQSATAAAPGGTTSYVYHTEAGKQGLLQRVTDPTGAVTQYTYGTGNDANLDFLRSTQDARGGIWEVTLRSPFGQAMETVSPEHRYVRNTWTPAGLMLSATDAMDYTSHYFYDSRERLTQVVNPGGPTASITYDELDRVRVSTDVNGNSSETQYDGLGRPKKVIETGIAALDIDYQNRPGGGLTVTRSRGTGAGKRIISIDEQDSAGRVVSSEVPRVLNPEANNNITYCKTTYHYTSNEGWLEKIQSPKDQGTGKYTVYTRDAAGRVLTVTSPEGKSSGTEYFATGWVKLQRNATDETKFEYDANGRPKKTTNPEKGFVSTEYYPTGQVKNVSPSLGAAISYKLDMDGIQTGMTDALGKEHITQVNETSRQIVTIVDGKDDRKVTQKLGSKGFVQESITPFGATTISTRNSGETQTLNAPGRGQFSQSFDSLDRVVSAAYPVVGSATSNYDGTYGDLTGNTDLLGNQTTHDIDPTTGDVKSTDDAGGNVMKVCLRDANGNVLKYKVHIPEHGDTPAHDLAFENEVNSDGQITTTTGPDGITAVYTRTPSNQISSITRPGFSESFKYNKLGQCIETVNNNRKTTHVYDALGLKQSSTVGDQTTTYTYDPNTRLLASVQQPGGRTVRYTRDQHGRVTDIQAPGNAANETIHYEYNDKDQVTQLRYPDGETETFTYKSNGDLETHTDRGGRVTTYSYDLAGRVVSKDLGDGTSVSIAYAADNRSTTETFNGSSVTRTVDARGRLTSVTQDGTSVTYTYRPDDSVLTKSYDGKTLTYKYDAVKGRLTQASDGADTASFAYDAQGRMNHLTLPNNVERSMAFNGSNELAAMTQTVDGSAENYSYSYDNNGRLKSLHSSSYNVAFAYDAAGRLTNETRSGSGQYRHQYAYDKNDNRTKQTSHVDPALAPNLIEFGGPGLPAQATVVTGSWSADGALHGMLTTPVFGDSTAHVTFNLGLNVAPPITVKVKPDILALQTGSVLSGIKFGETVNGRYLLAVDVSNAGVTPLQTLKLLWIPAGGQAQVVAESDPEPYTSGTWITLTLEFANDSISASTADGDMLISTLSAIAGQGLSGTMGLEVRTAGVPPATSVTSSFDDLTWNSTVGGTETRNYTYNALNQLLSISGAETTTFQYDDIGRMLQRVKDGIETTYGYDRLDRQTSMTIGVGTPQEESTAYAYYGPTWMRKTVQVGAAAATTFTHDGHACVAQTTAGATTHYFVPGSTPLCERTGTQTLTYAQDGRGNITGLFNGVTYAAKFNYDAFGNTKTTDHFGAAIANTSGPRYGGEFHDANTDQLYLRNRYYDPKNGRFNTIDPIGFNGGLNLYGYCQADPLNYSDPMGTKITIAGVEQSMSAISGRLSRMHNYGDDAGLALIDNSLLSRLIESDDTYDFDSVWDLAEILQRSGEESRVVNRRVEFLRAEAEKLREREEKDALRRQISAEAHAKLSKTYKLGLDAFFLFEGSVTSAVSGPGLRAAESLLAKQTTRALETQAARSLETQATKMLEAQTVRAVAKQGEKAAATAELQAELNALRQTLPERTATSGGTAGVAKTDLPGIESHVFKGASPKASGPLQSGGTIFSPSTHIRFMKHAEEDLANQIDRVITNRGYTIQQTMGKTVQMHIEQSVCSICRQGLPGSNVPAGVLKQLSDKHPLLTFKITNSATDEVLLIRGGKYIGQ
jgi:RHS repeat-associated protein